MLTLHQSLSDLTSSLFDELFTEALEVGGVQHFMNVGVESSLWIDPF